MAVSLAEGSKVAEVEEASVGFVLSVISPDIERRIVPGCNRRVRCSSKVQELDNHQQIPRDLLVRLVSTCSSSRRYRL